MSAMEQNLGDLGQANQAVSRLMRDFSVETTPRGALKIGDFREHLQPNTLVYVTCLPDSALSDTIDTCVTLAEQGMRPVPHFTARGISGKQELEENLARATSEAGVKQVLALAGADKKPLGEFADTMTMLETGLFEKYAIESIGVAGHPEGSPDFELTAQKDHGARKAQFAKATGIDVYLVTQFVFESAPVIDWIEHVRNADNNLPIVLGIPGLASLKSLIGHATACGVGASMTFLTKQAKNLHNILKLQAPEKLVAELAIYADQHPESLIRGIHMYPLGGLAPTAVWSYAAAEMA